MLTVEFSLPLVQVYTPALSGLILIMLRAISSVIILAEVVLLHDTPLLLLDTQGNDTLVWTSTVRLEGGARRN